MRYFKEYDKTGRLILIGAGDALNGVDITKEEYDALAADIAFTSECVEGVYRGEMSIEDVPERLRAEVQRQVDEMTAAFGPYDPDEISDAEALDIITGVTE